MLALHHRKDANLKVLRGDGSVLGSEETTTVKIGAVKTCDNATHNSKSLIRSWTLDQEKELSDLGMEIKDRVGLVFEDYRGSSRVAASFTVIILAHKFFIALLVGVAAGRNVCIWVWELFLRAKQINFIFSSVSNCQFYYLLKNHNLHNFWPPFFPLLHIIGTVTSPIFQQHMWTIFYIRVTCTHL